MSVKVRPYRRGGWEVDIRVVLPDGTERRERKKAPCASRSGATRWGQAREREILVSRPTKPRKEVPTLEEFAERFLDGQARANRQKPSAIASKERILRVHLIPRLGSRRLDAITNEHVQRLKRALSVKAPKTVNNVLSVLNTMLKTAAERCWLSGEVRDPVISTEAVLESPTIWRFWPIGECAKNRTRSCLIVPEGGYIAGSWQA